MPFAEVIRETCRYVTTEVAACAQGHASYHNLQMREDRFAQIAPLPWTASRMKNKVVFPESCNGDRASSKGRNIVGQDLRKALSRFQSVIAAHNYFKQSREHKEEEEEHDDEDDDAMIRKAAEKMWHPEWEEPEEDEGATPGVYQRSGMAGGMPKLAEKKKSGRFTVPGRWRRVSVE